MKREFDRLKEGPFDLLVIGGGVYGAWTALDAALRGLKAAVIDKGDWACATSSASTKLIHGGLRYLEHLRLDLVHSSLQERRQLVAIAPHRIAPVRFCIPLYEQDRVGAIKLKTGLWLYDVMAGEGQPVPPHRRLSREETVAGYPFLEDGHLRGSFLYGDCQTDDFRLVLEVIDAARRAGAVAVNYAKAVSLMLAGSRVAGAVVKDTVDGAILEVSARVVVNASGPWVPEIDGSHMLTSSVRFSRGSHLVMPALPTKDALLLMSREDNRIFFIVPWYGKSLLGTTDTAFSGTPDEVEVSEEEVDYLLEESRRHLKGVRWDRESILGAFAGLRTLQNEPGKALSQVTREWTALEPRPGLLVSIGGKYTTARLDASKMMGRVLNLLGLPAAGAPPTESHLLPASPRSAFAGWRKGQVGSAMAAGLSHETADSLVSRFGSFSEMVVDLVKKDPELGGRIHPDLPFCRAEAIYCARHEMVVFLEDLLRRRIPLTLLARPDRAPVQDVAALVAGELGWGAERVDAEVNAVMRSWARCHPKASEKPGGKESL